jgi:predicted metal-dependent phosphoesterase TrpH
MMKFNIQSANLHLHSRCSDGYLTPKQLVEKARSNSMDVISITDHDSVEAYHYLSRSQIPLRLLPGIEFSSTWHESDIHVLGYGIDVQNKGLQEILRWMNEGRRTRAQKMLHKLSEIGIKVPFELVLSFAGAKELIVRPHIAQALVSLKHCFSKQDAFERYIGNDGPAYVPKPILSTVKVIDFIHEAGGVAMIAHPGKIKHNTYLDDFRQAGVDGLEVWHPDHLEKQVSDFTEFCQKNGLMMTGGSDFHGDESMLNYIGPVPLRPEVLDSISGIWDTYKCRYL